MSDDVEQLRADLHRLQVHCAALGSLVADLLEITHRTNPEALRSKMTAESNLMLDPSKVGGLGEEALEAHRIRLALTEQALSQIEGVA